MSYTIKVNGKEFDLGNSYNFNLEDYGNLAYNNVITAQVKANAASYMYAYDSSNYSAEYKIYQAKEVDNLKVKDGVLSFDRITNKEKYNIYFNDELVYEETDEAIFSLAEMDVKYAGKDIQIKVKTLVGEEIKDQFGDTVDNYCDSTAVEINTHIVQTLNLNVSAASLSWQNLKNISTYKLFVNDVEQNVLINDNQFNLTTLANFNTLFGTGAVCELKVVPVLTNVENTAKTSVDSVVKVKQLSKPEINY